jgi:hypothetical protein
MRWITVLIFLVLVTGCASTPSETPASEVMAQWTPPPGRSELQVKRDYNECKRGTSSLDACMQSLGYKKK